MANSKKRKKANTVPKSGKTAPIELNVQALDSLLERGLKIKPVAACLNMSQETLRRRIHEISGQTFEQYRLAKVSPTAIKLIERAIELAMDGNVRMMEMCLINLAGWTKQLDESTIEQQKELVLKYSLDKPRDVTPVGKDHGHSKD